MSELQAPKRSCSGLHGGKQQAYCRWIQGRKPYTAQTTPFGFYVPWYVDVTINAPLFRVLVLRCLPWCATRSASKIQGGDGLVLHGLRKAVPTAPPQKQVSRQARSSLPRSQSQCPVYDCGGQHAAWQHPSAVCPMALRIVRRGNRHARDSCVRTKAPERPTRRPWQCQRRKRLRARRRGRQRSVLSMSVWCN